MKLVEWQSSELREELSEVQGENRCATQGVLLRCSK